MNIQVYILVLFLGIIGQSLAINGIHYCFETGSVFGSLRKYMDAHINDFWKKPIYACVRCMASVWGTIIFWSVVLPVFGFHWVELVLWVWDIFILVSLNYWVYKHL